MKRSTTLLFAGLLLAGSLPLHAHESGDLDSILAKKRKADISFAQLMQVMHQATQMIFDGILFENKEMITLGAHLLDEHPAPARGPAADMVPEKRAEFRNVMPAYDKVFHITADRIRAAAAKGQWQEAYAGYREITDACVACHEAWRPYALSRQPRAAP